MVTALVEYTLASIPIESKVFINLELTIESSIRILIISLLRCSLNGGRYVYLMNSRLIIYFALSLTFIKTTSIPEPTDLLYLTSFFTKEIT